MTPDETIRLCRMVKALCPSQAFDTYTPDAWSIVLAPYRYEDARDAVAALASMDLEPGRSRYIEPGHIIAQVKRIRTRRVEEHPPVDPPLGLDSAQYIAWQRDATRRIADGESLATRPTAVTDGGMAAAIAAVADALPSIES